MTVIYTSHYMEEVQALCQRIAILDNGTLLRLRHAAEPARSASTAACASTRDRPAPEFGERLAALPGVKKVTPTDGGFDVTTDSIPELLPRGDGARGRTRRDDHRDRTARADPGTRLPAPDGRELRD